MADVENARTTPDGAHAFDGRADGRFGSGPAGGPLPDGPAFDVASVRDEDEPFDALVVGGGPAGAATARTLARAGACVLLAERYALPRSKSCSGMLIEAALRSIRDVFGEPVPVGARCVPDACRGLVMYDQQGRRQAIEQEALNVRRDALDAWMVESAVEAGAQLREATSLVSFDEGGSCVSAVLKDAAGTQRVRARYLVLGDGVTGYLRRSKGFAGRRGTVTYQAFCEATFDGSALDPLCFHAFLQPELSEYDAWANVKDGLLVIGVAVEDAVRIRSFHEAFYDHLHRHFGARVDRIIRVEKWAMPRVRPGCPLDLGGGRVFVVGEATGLLNPMGEGISSAVESGRAAGRAIADALAAPSFAGASPEAARAAYEQAVLPLRHYMMRQWHAVSAMSDRFSDL